MHFNILDAREVPDVTESNKSSKTYTALAIALSTSEPKQAESWQRDEAR
jgi:hypothetical protein